MSNLPSAQVSRLGLLLKPLDSHWLGVAALLSGAVRAGGRVGVILSGGNMDAATLRAMLEQESDSPELMVIDHSPLSR